MPTMYKRTFPQVPANRWNAESHGSAGDVDERTAKSFYSIDAATPEEAELRVLAWIDHDYEDDLRHAEATADPVPVAPGRWRVTLEFDTREE
ncbi:hypothetical protein [Planobispora rosea]|nr:hypothetical protein [Planobispora rosea]